jgi:uncharacterized membrane protein YbhN (UPF0104 family)
MANSPESDEPRATNAASDLGEGTAPRSRLRSVISLVLLVGSVLYVAQVLWEQRGELLHAFDLSPVALVALFALMGVSHAQRTYEFTYMLARLGVREPFVDGFWLTGAGFLLNHLPLNVGLVMRAAVLKRDHALPYASYLSLVMVNALVNLAVAALLGLASVAFTKPFEPAVGGPLVAVFVLLLVLATGAMFLPLTRLPVGDGWIGRRLRLLADGISLIRGNGFGVALLGTLAFTKVVGAAFRMWICFRLLGADVSPLTAGLLASATIVFSLVNLTPGNLGLREVAMAAVAALLGSSYAVGMAAASIDRVVLLAYTIATGVPGLSALRRRGPFRGSRAR